MTRYHTTKLFYRKYTHQLIYKGRAGDDAVRWASEEMPGQFRKYRRKGVRGEASVTSIFCNRYDFDRMGTSCPASPISVCVPIDDRAEAMLREGVRIDIREKTYWNRYRYVMRFWVKNGEAGDLYDFLESRLGRQGQSHKVVRSRWFPSLYLRDDSQLTMMRLAAPPARLVETVMVYTHGEVSDSIR